METPPPAAAHRASPPADDGCDECCAGCVAFTGGALEAFGFILYACLKAGAQLWWGSIVLCGFFMAACLAELTESEEPELEDELLCCVWQMRCCDWDDTLLEDD